MYARKPPARLARAEPEESLASGRGRLLLQVPSQARELAEDERIREALPEEVPPGPRLALEAGIPHSRTWIGFWEDLEAGSEIAG